MDSISKYVGVQGLNGSLTWFIGIVEDVNDPLKSGRVKVRALGLHTQDTSILPTEDLPWAQTLQPISSGIKGTGLYPHVFSVGSWIFGFALDGSIFNQLIIVGSFTGIDTDNNLPSSSHLTFQTSDHPLLKKLREQRLQNIPTSVHSKFSEPEYQHVTEYPYNLVYEGKSGHTFQFDDTPNKEKIALTDNHGSYIHMNSDGLLEKSVNHSYFLTTKDQYAYVGGNSYETIVKDHSLLIQGDSTIKVVGNVNLVVAEGDVNLTIEKGNASVSVKGDLVYEVSGNVTEIVSGNKTTRVSGNITTESSGENVVKASAIRLN